MWVAIRKSTDEGLKYAEQNPAELAASVKLGGKGGGGGGGEKRRRQEICIVSESEVNKLITNFRLLAAFLFSNSSKVDHQTSGL